MNTPEHPLIHKKGQTLSLTCPKAMPQASAFLWNPSMMIQMNCRGYATAQFMQPEPAKYAHAPIVEGKTFMLPETQYYAHHPGRFFYVKNHHTGKLFSAPYEPVRAAVDDFQFIADQHKISWKITQDNIKIELCLSLMKDRPVELWTATVSNTATHTQDISLTPYFPVGFMSWMSQSASYQPTQQAIVCRSVTAYQKYPDYFKNKDLKDMTFLLAETPPDSWEARQNQFEGEGGLHAPSALEPDTLSNSDALYETPAAAVQYNLTLAARENQTLRFAFGPAKNEQEIDSIRKELFIDENGFENAIDAYSDYIKQGAGPLQICTPDTELDDFVNNWLARQVFYHGDVNRLSTDPQTRNYLQDNMGMSYIKPMVARQAFITALSQQASSGAMPDGILLNEEAELKYINQVPHMDHCVWLPVCLSAYLDETNDYNLLDEIVGFSDSESSESVREHINLAMRWLFEKRDERGLNYIEQGDWNDPMNMVGYKGRGVSGWLTLATAYACKLWADICELQGCEAQAQEFRNYAQVCNNAVNQHIWSDDWYGRGITDDGVLFGIAKDPEGRIFLNPQSWAILSGAANAEQQTSIIKAIEQQLETPYGVEMLAPAYTAMRDDVGRLTQKWPGVAENGSVYNHASAFYIYALYQIKQSDRAFKILRQMIPSTESTDLIQRGQLPVFIPNYYRGAFRQFNRTAGRSSQLFNTGTVHWVYRCLIDGLFGVQGCADGLRLAPQLPSDWERASLIREFRGARFEISILRASHLNDTEIEVDGELLDGNLIKNIKANRSYIVAILLGKQ